MSPVRFVTYVPGRSTFSSNQTLRSIFKMVYTLWNLDCLLLTSTRSGIKTQCVLYTRFARLPPVVLASNRFALCEYPGTEHFNKN